MRQLAGRVAVVTGAASGIGRALADRFAAEGMRVVLADIDRPRLERAESELRARGAEVLAAEVDVSRAEEVEGLAARTVEAFGAAHLLCNNAGIVSPPAPAWEKRPEDWERVLGVNLWGVVNGIRAFLPILLAQVEAHVVNTASGAGLICVPFGADYLASKHAVVSLSESLHLELQEMAARVKVSVLCPGLVRTRILDALEERSLGVRVRPELTRKTEELRRLLEASADPALIAGEVVEAVRAERFYILPDPELKRAIEARLGAILSGKSPPPG